MKAQRKEEIDKSKAEKPRRVGTRKSKAANSSAKVKDSFDTYQSHDDFLSHTLQSAKFAYRIKFYA